MKLLNCISFGATGVALGGCGGGGGGGTFNSRAALPLSVSATLPDGLVATMAEPSTTLALGSPLTYTISLKNNTSKPIMYTAITGTDGLNQVGASLTFVESTGTVLRDTTFSPVLGSLPETIEPGESLSATITPFLGLAPGESLTITPIGDTSYVVYTTAVFPNIGGSLPPLEIIVQR